jgi:oligopeptide/dipeptide ABC transporter ATP-binding protein
VEELLKVRDLTVRLATARGQFDAVSGLDLDLNRGEILALVGESGSGKSLTALAVMRLLPDPPASIARGSILFGGTDLASVPEERVAAIRGDRIGMVFQEPMTSLNPSMRVGPQVAEVLELHRGIGSRAARAAVEALFARVRIADPERRFDDYPHQMSGGMRQRAMIAMAIACEPDLVIADEPTTALDVTTQAQILDIFRDFRRDGRTMILITHDLGVVAETADRVAVMYAGRIVETAPVVDLFDAPQHPYTRGLLAAIEPSAEPGLVDPTGPTRLAEIAGVVPAPWALPPGCAFAPRCPRAQPLCGERRPDLLDVKAGHRAACWFPGDRGTAP